MRFKKRDSHVGQLKTSIRQCFEDLPDPRLEAVTKSWLIWLWSQPAWSSVMPIIGNKSKTRVWESGSITQGAF